MKELSSGAALVLVDTNGMGKVHGASWETFRAHKVPLLMPLLMQPSYST